MALTNVFKLADGVSFTQMDDEAVLLDLNTGTYFGLNDVGCRLVALLQQGLSLDESSARLASEFDIAQELALKDITRLVDDMVEKNLLSPV